MKERIRCSSAGDLTSLLGGRAQRSESSLRGKGTVIPAETGHLAAELRPGPQRSPPSRPSFAEQDEAAGVQTGSFA